LEKIEMKKTLVAVAAMAAVTGAMADVTIYGTIDQAYATAKVSTITSTSKVSGLAGVQNGGSAIGFKGSEDLGGGMKAYFQQELGLSTDSNDRTGTTLGANAIDGTATGYSNGLENRNSFVGLSGGFGDVKLGRMYNMAFYNAIAADPLGYSGVAGYAVGYAGAGGALRQSNTILYTLPTIAAGVGIQVAKVAGETVTTTAAPTKTGDSTSYGVTYAAGPLYAGITGETSTTTATTKTKNSTSTITYDLGMVKVGYGAGKTTLGTTYTKAGAVSLTVPLGALTLGYSSGDSKTNSTGSEVKTKISQYGAMYALSKRTTAYAQSGKNSATALNSSVTAFGILHNF